MRKFTVSFRFICCTQTIGIYEKKNVGYRRKYVSCGNVENNLAVWIFGDFNT